MTEELHAYAREVASSLRDPDKKQLRFNDIVEVAQAFYPADPRGGVRELVLACDRASSLYAAKASMADTLRKNYGWMLG